MGKNLHKVVINTLGLVAVCVAPAAFAEDIYLDCAGNQANSPQCQALYAQNNYLPQVAQQPAVHPGRVDPANPNAPINATPGADYTVPGLGYEVPQQQIIVRDSAAPIAVSQPLPDTEEIGTEYSVYKTQNGSLIVENDVSVQDDGNGGTIQVSRKKETSISPAYVEMPSISSKRRSGKIAYGDAVHDWEALRGDSLRTLLTEWGEKSGWTVVWKLDRDYILEAGVVFRGNFTEVASAIIRTFARATPAPIGTFYKGNRVLVINTQEDDNA